MTYHLSARYIIVLLYVQEVLTHLYSNLLYAMEQDLFTDFFIPT